MKVRKSKDIAKVLSKKGFRLNPQQQSHSFYILFVDNKKTHISTFLSHGSKDYDRHLMSEIKKQLRFRSNDDVDAFFDCPMSGTDYIEMLKSNDDL